MLAIHLNVLHTLFMESTQAVQPKEYRVYFTNHAYYAHECFETADKAIEYGKSKYFDFSVQEIGKGLNPYTFQTTQVATWSVFGGLRRRAA